MSEAPAPVHAPLSFGHDEHVSLTEGGRCERMLADSASICGDGRRAGFKRGTSDEALLRDVRDYLAERFDPEYAHMSPALGPLLERLNARLGPAPVSDCHPLDVIMQRQPDGTARIFIRTDLPPEDVWQRLAQGVPVTVDPRA